MALSIMRRTSSISVSGVQVSGWSSITLRDRGVADRAAVVDDRLDHLAEGQHADQLAVVHDDQRADVVLGHRR